jgi:protein TonB
MADTHASPLVACALALSFTLVPLAGHAQSTIQHAQSLYVGAQCEESLAILQQLQATTLAEKNEIAAYRVFCLIALGRTDDAAHAIEAIVSDDPFYQPPDALASPRIRAAFKDTREKVLPSIVNREYTAAKMAFDRKDPQAADMFDRVLKLLADPDLAGPSKADLKVLAEGFRDLSRTFSIRAVGTSATTAGTPAGAAGSTPASAAGSTPPARTGVQPGSSSGGASAAAAPAAPPETRAPAPAANIDAPVVRASREGDVGVVAPVALSQVLPRWNPPSNSLARRQAFSGVIEVQIDEHGTVTAATMRASIHPQYDPDLIAAARTWKFKPAMKDGKPVPYTKLVEVRLRPASEQ